MNQTSQNSYKSILIPALLLMIFAIVGTGLVSITDYNTREEIKYNKQRVLLRTLNNILPDSTYNNKLIKDTLDLKPDYLLGTTQNSIAYRARKNGKPVAIVLSPIAPNGYNGPLTLLVGIYFDGTLAGVRVVNHRETPGLGDVVESKKSDWILGFSDKSLQNPEGQKKWKVKRDGGEFDQFTGATVTPRAVVKAIHSTLIYFNENRQQLFK